MAVILSDGFKFNNRYYEILNLLLNKKKGLNKYKIALLLNKTDNIKGVSNDLKTLENYDLIKSVDKNGVKFYLINIERIKRYRQGIFIRVKISDTLNQLIFSHCPFMNECNNCSKGGEITGNCKFYDIISKIEQKKWNTKIIENS